MKGASDPLHLLNQEIVDKELNLGRQLDRISCFSPSNSERDIPIIRLAPRAICRDQLIMSFLPVRSVSGSRNPASVLTSQSAGIRVRESSCLTSGVAYPTLWKHEKGSGNRFRRACCPGSHLRRTPAESPGFQHPTRVPSIVTIIIGQEPTYPVPKTLLRHEFSRTVQTRSLRSRRSVGFIIGISAKQHSFANRPGSDNRRRSSG